MVRSRSASPCGTPARRPGPRSPRSAPRCRLLTAVPAALLAAVIMMILGHLVGGLALFGGSVLAAAVAVAIAGMAGMQHLRKLLSRASFNAVQLDHGQYTDDVAEPNGSDYTDVVHLDRSEYTEVR
jgi:hypothetical protein